MAIPDDFVGHTIGLDSPYVHAVAVTPNDGVDLPFRPRAITCQVAGIVRLQWNPGGATSDHSIALGIPLRARPIRIFATGTTATGLAILR